MAVRYGLSYRDVEELPAERAGELARTRVVPGSDGVSWISTAPAADGPPPFDDGHEDAE